MRVVKLILT